MMRRQPATTKCHPATAFLLLCLVLAPAAAAVSAPVFSGKTAQGVTLSFHQAGATVSGLKTSLTVFCITAYPASSSNTEIFAFAPRASAKIANGRFVLRLPTVSKGQFATLTGTIHGTRASGTASVDYDKSGNVFNPATGYYALAVYSCQAKTTWKAREG